MAEFLIHYLESTDSTMLEARRLVGLAEKGMRPPVLSGSVVQAGFQTAGRGRISERKWESDPGDSLLFTVVFSKADLRRRMSGRALTLLPLLCGLAVAETIEALVNDDENCSSDSEIRIKWPNDVLSKGRKLSGILCEASGEWFYAGIGINLNQKQFADGLRRPACSVSMLTGRRVDSSIFLNIILKNLDDVLSRECWQADIESRMYRIGEVVEMKQGLAEESAVKTQNVKGLLAGLDSSGAVLIKTADGIHPVSSGDLL